MTSHTFRLDNSLIEILIDDCVFGNGGGFDYIYGGFDQLPNAFIPHLEKNIVFHSKVFRIQQVKQKKSKTFYI